MKRRRILASMFCAGVSSALLFLWLHRPNAQIDPLQAVALDLCNGKACFLGITPGQTSWAEVKAILAPRRDALLDTEQFTVNDRSFDAQGYFVNPSGEPSSTNTTSRGPNHISIVPKNAVRITLQTVIQKYGPPCGVSLFYRQCNTNIAVPENIPCQRYQHLTVNYPGMRLTAILAPDDPLQSQITELTPDLPLYSLELFDPTGYSVEPKTCTIRFSIDQIASTNAPWLGFSSIQRYSSHSAEIATEKPN